MTQLSSQKRWFRYSLRSLFALVTIFALWLGWEVKFIHERQAIRAWLREGNGWEVTWEDYKNTPSPPGRAAGDPTMQIPIWRKWLGDEPIALLGFEPSATPADRARVKQLFPEAEISEQ